MICYNLVCVQMAVDLVPGGCLHLGLRLLLLLLLFLRQNYVSFFLPLNNKPFLPVLAYMIEALMIWRKPACLHLIFVLTAFVYFCEFYVALMQVCASIRVCVRLDTGFSERRTDHGCKCVCVH